MRIPMLQLQGSGTSIALHGSLFFTILGCLMQMLEVPESDQRTKAARVSEYAKASVVFSQGTHETHHSSNLTPKITTSSAQTSYTTLTQILTPQAPTSSSGPFSSREPLTPRQHLKINGSRGYYSVWLGQGGYSSHRINLGIGWEVPRGYRILGCDL